MHDDSHLTGPISGHVYLKPGKRGASWYFRARLPHEVRKRLGPAWTGKGRPPAGYFTRKTAEAQAPGDPRRRPPRHARRALSRPARRSPTPRPSGYATSSTTASASRPRSPTTRACIKHALDPEFGTLPLEAGDDGADRRVPRTACRGGPPIGADDQQTAGHPARRPPSCDARLRAAVEPGGARRPAAAPTLRRLRRCSPPPRSRRSPAPPRATRTPRSSGSPRSPGSGSASCVHCAGATSTSRSGSSTFAATSRTAPRALRSRAACAASPMIDQAARALDGLSRRERFIDDDDLVFVDELGDHVDDWRLRRRFHAALERSRSAEAPPARPAGTRSGRSRCRCSRSPT